MNKELKDKSEKPVALIRSKDLKDIKVINKDLIEIGEIEDIIVDYNHGVLAYAVVSIENILNEKLHIIPWQCFEFNPIENAFELKVEKDKLKKAPSFNKGEWPDFQDLKWHTDIHTYYAITPYWRVQGEHVG